LAETGKAASPASLCRRLFWARGEITEGLCLLAEIAATGYFPAPLLVVPSVTLGLPNVDKIQSLGILQNVAILLARGTPKSALTTHDNSTYHVYVDAQIVPVSSALQNQADTDEKAIKLWLHGKAAHSQRAYRLDIERFRSHVSKPLPAVTLEDLQMFADSLGELASATKKRILAAVKSLLTFSLKIGYTRFNVGAALTIKRPKNTLAERILPHEDVSRIIEREHNLRNHAILWTLYQTGARVSELCGLKWRDVQPRADGFGQMTLFGKGYKTRHVLISKRLHNDIVRLRGDAGPDAPVFASKTGKPLDQPCVFRIIRAAAKRAGIEQAVSPHWLRHACASNALDNGAPISLVKEQLGHSSLEITSVYTHARPQDGLFKYLR
jgi:integrase/recombinase XerD